MIRRAWLAAGVTGLVAGAFIGALAWPSLRPGVGASFSSAHHAMVLNGGQLYFGRLQYSADSYYVLTDVFYVVARNSPDSRQPTNTLVKRGNEAHGPSKMFVPAHSVLFIEPVSADSQLGKLIAEAKR